MSRKSWMKKWLSKYWPALALVAAVGTVLWFAFRYLRVSQDAQEQTKHAEQENHKLQVVIQEHERRNLLWNRAMQFSEMVLTVVGRLLLRAATC